MLRHFLLSLFLITSLVIPAAQADTLKIATLSPDGTTWMNTMRAAAQEVEKQTQGRVKIKFYPGGVMGDEKAILQKMRINQLQGGAVTTGALIDAYHDAEIYSLSFMFNNQEEVDYVRSKMDPLIVADMEKSGFISFGLAESGFAYVLSQHPVNSVSDLLQQKAWIPDNTTARDAVKAFNLNPIPLPIGDVLAGLQTSLIDTVAVSPIGAIALQWYSQVKYLTDMPLLYAVATMIVSKKAFDKLEVGDQKILREEMSRAFAKIDAANKKDNRDAKQVLQKQGIQFITPSEKDQAEWKRLADRSNQDLLNNGHISKKMYDTLTQHLQTFRNKK